MDYTRKERLRFWPTLHPPILTRLPQSQSNQQQQQQSSNSKFNPRNSQLPTLQDEIDKIEWEEDRWFQTLHDTRIYGYSWLVPLGRQNTQEEDQESIFSPSPRAQSPQLATTTEGEEGTDDTDMDAVDLDAAIEDRSNNSEDQEEEGEGEDDAMSAEEEEEEGVNSDEGVSLLGGGSVEESEAGSDRSRDDSVVEE